MAMTRALSTLFPALIMALAFAGADAAPAAQGLTGHWSGVVNQTGPGQKPQQFVATLTLNGDAGTMDYPTMECGGDVALVSRSAAGLVYRETINRGQGCLSGGVITVQPSKASVLWRWDGAPGITVSGRLYRIAAPPAAAAAH
jgi:hypothetical protein